MLPIRCIYCLRHTEPRRACIHHHGHDYTDNQVWLQQVEALLEAA